MIAAILESGDLDRLYTGLSLLVSAAADGRPERGLAGLGALGALLAERLAAGCLRREETPHLTQPGRETFARSLEELRELARSLEDCRIWACAAAVETTGASAGDGEARPPGGMLPPR